MTHGAKKSAKPASQPKRFGLTDLSGLRGPQGRHRAA